MAGVTKVPDPGHARTRGRYSAELVSTIRAEGLRIGAELDAGAQWWDDRWVNWKPDPAWIVPALGDGWRDVPV